MIKSYYNNVVDTINKNKADKNYQNLLEQEYSPFTKREENMIEDEEENEDNNIIISPNSDRDNNDNQADDDVKKDLDEEYDDSIVVQQSKHDRQGSRARNINLPKEDLEIELNEVDDIASSSNAFLGKHN